MENIEIKKSWAEKYAESPHADKWLAVFSFTESSFFPLPPSTLMVTIMSVGDKHKRWFYYATLTTVTSVLGGVFGYLVGSIFYETIGQSIINTYKLADDMERVSVMFNNNAFLAILIAAFTPIPYKVFTIAGGFFKIDLITFIVASIIGRGARFYLVAFIVNLLGNRVEKKIMSYINKGAFITAVIIVTYFLYKVIAIAYAAFY